MNQSLINPSIHLFPLVTIQFNGDYGAREEHMGVYLKVVHDLSNQFNKFELTRIPRGENISADALAALVSTSDPTVRIVYRRDRETQHRHRRKNNISGGCYKISLEVYPRHIERATNS